MAGAVADGRLWWSIEGKPGIGKTRLSQLAKLVELVDGGVVAVDIAESHPLTEMATIHRRSDVGQTNGKIILRPVEELTP